MGGAGESSDERRGFPLSETLPGTWGISLQGVHSAGGVSAPLRCYM